MSSRLAAAPLVLAALAAAAAAPRRAAAQEPADTFALPGLVVTATRLPTRAEATPVAVSVVTGAELRARGIVTVADALRTLPGVAVAQPPLEGGVSSLFIRGGESDYVKVLVDGVPANGPGGAYDFSHLTTDDVERIEVVRGPASVLYGSDAVTGVVQIFTREGAGPPRVAALVRTAVADRLDVPGAPAPGRYATTEWSARASGGGSVASYSVEGSRLHAGEAYAFNSAYGRNVVSARLALRPDPATDASLTLRRTGTDYHYPTDGAGALVDRNQADRGSFLTLGLDAGHRFGEDAEARLLLGTDETADHFRDPPDGPADTLGYFAYTSDAKVYRRSADLRLNLRAAAGTILTVGAALEREHERSSSLSGSQYGPSADSQVVGRWNRAGYAQLLTRGSGGITLDGGLRLDDNQGFGRFLTWRAGATWRLAEGTRLRAAAGTAFKEPTFYETYARGYVTGNPDLEPERSRSLEGAIGQRALGGRLDLEATLFRQRFHGLVQYDPSPSDPGTPNYYNLGAARADGLEVSARATLRPDLLVSGSFTRLSTAVIDQGIGGDPSFTEGQPLLRRPASSGSLTGEWRLPGGGRLAATMLLVGRRADLDFSTYPARRVTLPAYTRVDLAAERPLLGTARGRPALALRLRVEDLLGTPYRDVYNFPPRSRSISLGLSAGTGF